MQTFACFAFSSFRSAIVFLSRRDRGVPRQLLSHRDIGPSIEQITDERSPHVVRAKRLDTSLGGATSAGEEDGVIRHSADIDPAALVDGNEERPRRVSTTSEPFVEGRSTSG